ncbi:hypothetical protein Hypma_001567 [Hypsizygus marmoreus]|uniref:Uncharacterized protein n=1 Tax=Hypsizygus marmoreus TaxID=39966 RepID=A0A369K298_HYPMA|nr:hypothetical protein Hypma_001567 [Hypsizygus marmoreus]
MILAILEELSDKALVAMAGICHHIRPLSISVYFYHLGVLTSESGSQELQLSQTMLAMVFLFLSSTHLKDDVTFTCDVFYLLEYSSVLGCQSPPHKSAILHALKVACTLSFLLGFLSTQCQFIMVETLSFSAFTSHQVLQSVGHLGGTAYDAKIRTLMSTAHAIALTDDLFQILSLAKVRSLLLKGPNVKDFGLTCMSMQKNRSGAILSQVNFPALQYL